MTEQEKTDYVDAIKCILKKFKNPGNVDVDKLTFQDDEVVLIFNGLLFAIGRWECAYNPRGYIRYFADDGAYYAVEPPLSLEGR